MQYASTSTSTAPSVSGGSSSSRPSTAMGFTPTQTTFSSSSPATPATSSTSTAAMGSASANGNGKGRETVTTGFGTSEGISGLTGAGSQVAATASGPDGRRSGSAQHGAGAGAGAIEEDADEDAGLLEYLYQRGFINGDFSDVQLHFRPDRHPLKLHSLVISRSPTLLQELRHPQEPQRDIFCSIQDREEITDEAFQISISYLYSTRALGHVNTSNAAAVLSAATLLQLPKLASHAFRICRENIGSLVSPSDVKYWIAFLEREKGRSAGAAQNGKERDESYSQELEEGLMHRLIVTLPTSLHAFSTSVPTAQQAEAQTILQHVYSALPFDMFKAVLESPSLGTSGESGVKSGAGLSDQTRFGLAKKCILERKKIQAAASRAAASPGAAGAQDAAPQVDEESVVLAFGTGSGSSNVQVVKKAKAGRKLWKVNS